MNIDCLIKPDSCYRPYESRGFFNFLCCGFLDKSGKKFDTVEKDYPFYALVYTLRGEGELSDWRGKKHPVSAGDCVQRIPGRKHSLTINPQSRWLECFIGFCFTKQKTDGERGRILKSGVWPDASGGGRETAELLPMLGVSDPERAVFHAGVRPELIMAFRDFLERLKICRAAELGSLALPALSLVRTVSGAGAAPDAKSFSAETAGRIADAIDADISGEKTIPELLKKIPLSYSRLRAVFKRETGMSPEEHRIRRRVGEACRMLSSGGMTPSQAAAGLGYKSYFAFSAQFKQMTGISPRDFIRAFTAGGGANKKREGEV